MSDDASVADLGNKEPSGSDICSHGLMKIMWIWIGKSNLIKPTQKKAPHPNETRGVAILSSCEPRHDPICLES